MLSCEEITLLLSQQLDEELSKADRLLLEEHLATCPDCCALSESLACLHEDLQSLAQEPPADLSARIMASIREESSSSADITVLPIVSPAKKRAFWRQRTSIAAALAVIILGTTGLVLFPPSSGGAPMDTIAYVTTAAPEEMAEEAEASAPPVSKSSDPVDASASPANEGEASEGGTAEDSLRYTMQTDSEYVADEPDLQITGTGEPMAIDSTIADIATIDEEVALYILRAHLELDTVDSLSYVGLSEDGLHYMFHHCPDADTVTVYLVSILDGTVSVPLP